MSQPTPEAIERLADAIARQGAAWERAAQSVRDGFSNIWIEPALKAIDQALDEGREQ